MTDERRKSILLAVMKAVLDLVKVKTVASEVQGRIHEVLECQFDLDDNIIFRGNMWQDTAKLVCLLLEPFGYPPGYPPKSPKSPKTSKSAHLPPEEQNIEAGETSAEGERMKSIMLVVMMAVHDLVEKKTLASEIKSRIREVLEGQFIPNDSNEFGSAVSTKTGVLVKSLLLTFGYYFI